MSLYQDLDLTLTKHPATKDLTRKIDADAIKNALKNIILGNNFKIPYNGYFVGLERFLFEMNDGLSNSVLARRIDESIKLVEPRCILESVKLRDTDADAVHLIIEFSMESSSETQVLNLSYSRER